MFDKYLVTGATGFLGRAVVEELVRRRAQVYALVLHNDPYIDLLPKEVHTDIGDVCDKSSLADFFAGADSRTCVIHCAGIVSVASRPGPRLYQVNVGGTWKVLRQCMEHGVGKMLYVSSVHAIPEKPKGCIITEDCEFSPGLVDGDYAKSKATATDLVFDAAERGLNASIVFPSGIIGPGDLQGGSFTSMAKSFLAGKLPLAVRGGYDFVDVRDVAAGILACSESGEPGKGYILSGHYVTIRRMLQVIGTAAKRRYRPICLPFGSCKAGGSVLRTSESEGPKAVVFHPTFRFRSCLKRAIQPCRSNEMLCLSAAPDGGDSAGHDSLAFGAERKGRSVTSSQAKAPWTDCACATDIRSSPVGSPRWVPQAGKSPILWAARQRSRGRIPVA